MSASQISLSMLARSAYRTPGPQARDDKPGFREELARQTVKDTPAVSIELSDAARSALLALQEIAAAPAENQAAPNPDTVADFKEFAIGTETPSYPNTASISDSDPIKMADPLTAQIYEKPGSRLNVSI